MAFIDYVSENMIPPEERVPDRDNILRIYCLHYLLAIYPHLAAVARSSD